MRGNWLMGVVTGLSALVATPAWGQAGQRVYSDDILRCEPKGEGKSLCAADTSRGVRLLRSLTSVDCQERRNWGVTDEGVWVSEGCRGDFLIGKGGSTGIGRGTRVMKCESKGNRWTHCNTDTRYGVQLANQISKNPCMKSQTWGVDTRGIWVSGGCRAEFRVLGSEAVAPASRASVAADPPPQIVRCDSNDRLPRHCPANTTGGVRLFRQLSRAACVEGRSWGFDRNGIWVEDGCRGEFELATAGRDGG